MGEIFTVKRRTNEKTDKRILKFCIKFAGGFAGVMAWLISYPADVVKSRLQAQDGFNDQNDNESYDLL